MEWQIQLCELNYDMRETEAVNQVLSSQWLTMGQEVDRFEKEFSAKFSFQNQGVFVSSATAGLHLILMALGVGYGDEVIIPGLTFVSDANVILQLGAVPIFADCDIVENFNVSTQSILSRVTPKTKAIIVVHFAGYPIQLDNLRSFCDDNSISLIEDCAHSPGAKIDEIHCGTLGHFAFHSFFSNKNIAIGEGGMVNGCDKAQIDKIRLMRSHGMTSVTLDRHEGRSSTYDVEIPGLNYRGDEIRAALGRVQLEKLNSGNNRRKQLVLLYTSQLANSEIIVPFRELPKNYCPAFHIMPVLLPVNVNRDKIMHELRKSGIQTSIHYPNFANFKAYRNFIKLGDLPIVDEICERSLTLPLHPNMTDDECIYVSQRLMELI